MMRFFATLTRRSWLPLGLSALVFAGGVGWLGSRVFRQENPLLTTPALAVELLTARTPYFTPAARPWLLSRRPELVTAEDRDPRSERTRAFADAAQNAQLFRTLDRRYRFDALLISGDPGAARPLLDHLNATQDWTFVYADHTSLVFHRAAERRWQMADFDPVRARFAQRPARERATVLAQTAIRLLAVREVPAARQLLDEAQQLAPAAAEVGNAFAIYHMDRGEWREALAAVERALKQDRHFLPALATKTQLLFANKQFSAAYDLSRGLLEKFPSDPSLLFHHAKIAHQAHAYQAEIAALEKLIALATAEQRRTSGYRIYLGQAYASVSDAPHAIENFQTVLSDPDLPNDQRDFARENITRIKQRSGL